MCKKCVNGETVTFGISPTGSETGFGYLQLGENSQISLDNPKPLISFVEEPHRETAQKMLDSGNYLWNAGIFMFSIKTIIDAFEKLAPDILKIVIEAFEKGNEDVFFSRLEEKIWAESQSISIDCD